MRWLKLCLLNQSQYSKIISIPFSFFIFTNKSEGKTCADTISIPDEYKDNYACFTFKSFISSDGDEYSLVIPRINNDERQGEFLKMLEGIFYHKL